MHHPIPTPAGAMFRLAAFALGGLAAQLFAQAPAAPVVADFGGAILENWVQPDYPDAARKARQEGSVAVEFVVETDGTVSRERVTDSTAAVFDAAALAAVRRWHFRPGIEEARPAATAMEVRVQFQLAQLHQKQVPLMPPVGGLPSPLKVEPAGARTSIDPDYPAELDSLRLPGMVRIKFEVDATGRARQPRVLMASHPAFVESALRALERAEFKPAHQGPLPRASTMEYPVGFESMGAKPSDILAANRLEVVLGDGLKIPPQPLILLQPVYPRERLLAAEAGTVVAEFTIDAEGRTGEVRVSSATGGDFAAATVAAIEASLFRPPQGEAGPQVVRMRVTQEFVPTASGGDLRLAELLRPGGAGVGGAAGLDQKLKPLWRGFPVYPRTLEGADAPAGSAEIEFVIDREGRSRLPRVVKATADVFGWAAATAISQWVFEKPVRGGEAVDVTVRIPVAFQAPAR